MQVTIPVASVATSQSFVPLKQDQNATTDLVAHWLKNQDGKLYCTWVSTKG